MKNFNFLKKILITTLSLLALTSFKTANSSSETFFWMKISAKDKFERSVIASTGAAIEIVKDDYVIAYGSDIEKAKFKKMGWLVASSNIGLEDFPSKDSAYHNYQELSALLQKLHQDFPNITELKSIAKTIEGRDLWALRISSDLQNAGQKPAVIFMGGHHAREHLSVELPLHLAKHLLEQYQKGDERITRYLNSRDIHIIPVVNPDGKDYDISGDRYKMWRKNRSRNANGTFGVDLNRNYGYKWGTGGSSSSPNSETYMGPTPFSEVESKAIKDYVEANENITILLSFHTYSKLILYPWGHTYSPIETARDKQIHETMANKMSQWNGYTPQQSSELYIASGDTTDWSYGVHKIISFTFELDPAGGGFGGGGFYPGDIIQATFQKNLEPALYLMEYADNPGRVLNFGIHNQ